MNYRILNGLKAVGHLVIASAGLGIFFGMIVEGMIGKTGICTVLGTLSVVGSIFWMGYNREL